MLKHSQLSYVITFRNLKRYIFEQVLLSRISFFGPEEIPDEEKLGLQMYSKTAEYVMCSILPDSPTKTTKMTDGKFFSVPKTAIAALRNSKF